MSAAPGTMSMMTGTRRRVAVRMEGTAAFQHGPAGVDRILILTSTRRSCQTVGCVAEGGGVPCDVHRHHGTPGLDLFGAGNRNRRGRRLVCYQSPL